MKKLPIGILCTAAAIAMAAPASAAQSDYLLVIDGVDGEASVAIEVQSWSWGASNPGVNIGSSGQDGAARERPTVTASQNTQSLRESPTRASTGRDVATGQSSGRNAAGGVNVASGDLDGDGRIDLEGLAKVDEVSGFTLTLAPGAASRSSCATGKHIKEAHLVARGTVYDLEDLVISSCTGGSGGSLAMAVTGKTREFRGHVTLMK